MQQLMCKPSYVSAHPSVRECDSIRSSVSSSVTVPGRRQCWLLFYSAACFWLASEWAGNPPSQHSSKGSCAGWLHQRTRHVSLPGCTSPTSATAIHSPSGAPTALPNQKGSSKKDKPKWLQSEFGGWWLVEKSNGFCFLCICWIMLNYKDELSGLNAPSC